ncbi:MAG: hypothetical protein A3J38_07495 [Gammaproteobacteria bacterium RIFCSPHIGHO2_12_FULL_45_9]|nr:MAG: hypothetical protein A3J38_07495 [Gammaproteobacteria bacterium RIFCSPHIGHO2_12_FULL_45_9]
MRCDSTTAIDHIRTLTGIFLLSLIGVFGMDFCLPALPAITIALHTSVSLAKLTIAIYFGGMCSGLMIFGPLSDQYGRRKVLMSALSVALIGSIICALTPNIHGMMLGRFLQGFGLASGMTLGRTILQDLFPEKQFLRISAYLGMMTPLIIAVAPTIGGYIQELWGWRMSFSVLCLLVATVTVYIALYVPESNRQCQHGAAHPTHMCRFYWQLLRTKHFLIYPLLSGTISGGWMVYLTISPFLLQNEMGLSPIAYGHLAVLNAAAIIIGSFLNARLVSVWSPHKMILMGSIGTIIAAGAMLGMGLLGWLSVMAIVIPLFFYLLFAQWVLPQAAFCTSRIMAQYKGYTSSLHTTIQLMLTLFFSLCAALLPMYSQIPMSAFIFGGVLLGLLCLLSNKDIFR